jgi:hypothetical protein
MKVRNLSALLLAVSFLLSHGSAAESDVSNKVTLKFLDQDTLFVPTNLTWGEKSIVSARRAIKFQQREFTSAIGMLQKAGAVRVNRVPVENEFMYFKDAKTYVNDYRQYKLEGIDKQGKTVLTSEALPSNVPNLASFLVGLKQDSCYLESSGAKVDEVCALVVTKPEKYLRASLRTALDRDMLGDNLYWIRNQLDFCLKHEKRLSVRNSSLYCPGNKYSFFSKYIDLKGKFLTRSYSVKVNLVRRTAVMTVSKRDFGSVAKTAQYQGSDVLRFG